jgi:hypothetical protein
MKTVLPLIAVLMLAFVPNQAMAQSQEQQACEGDVYDLCGEAIPDQDKIVVCLRKHWSKVSKECRHVMVSYAKNHRKTMRHKNHKDAVKSGPDAAN